MGERVPQDTLAKFHWSLSRVGEPKAPGTEWTAELPRVGNSWFRVQGSRLDFSALELVRTPFISQPIAPRGTGTLKSQSGNLEIEPQTFSFLDLSLFLWRRSKDMNNRSLPLSFAETRSLLDLTSERDGEF